MFKKIGSGILVLLLAGIGFVWATRDPLDAPLQLLQIVKAWTDPISHGAHYVWLYELEPARPTRLEEVTQQLRQELSGRARSDALQRAKEFLRAEYEVRT